MLNIRDLEVQGRRVLVRVDFNVPMTADKTITDDIRIRRVLPTISHLLEAGARLVLCSHLGRPQGERRPEFSLEPVAAHLTRILERPVRLAPDCVGGESLEMTRDMEPGEVVLLENLRFHAGETANDPEFARALAEHAEVYVNDAFAVSHRAHASVVGVPALVEHKAAGFLLQKEMDYFHRSMDDPARPLLALVGGAKVSSKLGALHNMLGRVDAMLIGGAMANTFLKAQGLDVGASRVEEDLVGPARDFLAEAGDRGVLVFLPVDVIAAERFAADAACRAVPVQRIPAGWVAADIGPATVRLFAEVVEEARTIVWNGPMGAFEMDPFARGTMAMVEAVAQAHALSITGGGDSNAAVHKSGLASEITYMSTGGGAFLMLMEGKTLPGVAALEPGE